MNDHYATLSIIRRPAARLAAVTALTCALAASPSSAQPAPSTAPTGSATTQPAARSNGATNGTNGPATRHVTTQPGGGLVLNFNNASIDSVLDELSAVAGFIVVKETSPLSGRVTLVSKQPVKPEEAINLLNTVLKNAGYAAIQQGRTLKIVQRATAKKVNIPVRSGADPSKIDASDELITQVIPLKQVDATQLRQDLQPLISADADFTANASSNTLVMTDTSANIKRIVEVVAALDSSLVGAAEVKVFQLKYATAANAARLVNDLFGDAARARGQQSQQQGQQPQFGFGGGFPGGGFQGFGGGRDGGRDGGRGNNQQNARQAIRVNASSDDRTNTVVVTGPPETLAVIEKVVKEIDANPAAEETVFVYKIKNGQALNVEYVMNLLFNGTSSGGGRSTRSSGYGTGGVRSNSRSTGGIGSGGRSGGLGSSGGLGGSGGLGSNRLSATGGFGSGALGSTGGFGGQGLSGSRFGGTGFGGFAGGGGFGGLSQGAMQSASAMGGQVSVIADEDTNSLLIRTSPKNFEQLKAILDELDRPVAQVLIKVLIAEVTHDNATDFGAQFSILNLRASGNGQQGTTNFNIPAPGTIAQGMIVQILEENFTATLRALESQGKLDVLSRPYILASDNQLATITVGQEVPFITRSQLTEDGTTNNVIEYDDIGILLDVIPHINPDGLVILDVAPEISALTGNTVPISSDVEAPTIAKRSAQSRVGVMNGQTIVIGGLMEDRKTQSIDKVPILGDIPVLGWAFKRQTTNKVKTELLIFLTPHVAAQPDQLKGMSKDEVEGTKLTPNAVEPGAFQDHMRGMQRGNTANDPANQPATQQSEPTPYRMFRPPAPEPAPEPGFDPQQPPPIQE